MRNSNRRRFLKTSLAGTLSVTALGGFMARPGNAAAQAQASGPFAGTLKKSLYYSMLPEKMGVEEKFALAKKLGFEGIEIPTLEDSASVAEFKAAAQKTGLIIHSIMNQRHWGSPLSSSDPAVVKKSLEGMEISLRNAKELGATTVLLVPGVVNADTTYREAYTRSQKHIRELLPLAKELKVMIAVENVWNKFLLSPLEFARYVDEFQSPWLRAYFDVGNIVLYGFPQDWIRTLGKRIAKVHVKGFDEKKREFTSLYGGTIDWPAVRKAFSDIGYSGYVNAELGGGDEEYLRGVSDDLGKIFAGEKA
jgi:L-ribulose-5-phosphate 3-epimerase